MPSTDRPNLLFINTDQFRHDWLGCAGADWVSTPNIDAIAERGVRFTQCVTPSPICAPARISLATGLMPRRMGALSNHEYLPLSTPTYYQRLRDHGYHVGCVGKLDLAKSDKYNGVSGARPRTFAWGFTHPVEAEGKMHAGSSATPIGPYTKWLDDQDLLAQFHEDYTQTRKGDRWIERVALDSALPTEAFEDIWIGRRSEQWIDEIDGDYPWHLFVSFVGPHDPFDPPTEYADKYRDKPMPGHIVDNFDGKPDWIRKRAANGTDEEIAITRRQYSASVTAIDDAIAGIMAALERRGWADNTYVVFSSDHGEMLGDHDLFTKHSAYETSMRIPLIVAGPGIAGGRTSDALVELEDVNPTLCEMADVPPLENIDGQSFLDVVAGKSSAARDVTVTEEENYRAARTREWKYIESHNDRDELYDLVNDPNELHNVIDKQPDAASDMRRKMNRRLREGQQHRG
jgi:arylsulfatase